MGYVQGFRLNGVRAEVLLASLAHTKVQRVYVHSRTEAERYFNGRACYDQGSFMVQAWGQRFKVIPDASVVASGEGFVEYEE